MKNLILVRIDDRLIHGQVMTGWVKATKAKRIIIADNKVNSDDFLKSIIKMAAPAEVMVDIYNEEEAMAELIKELQVPTILLVKTPVVLNNLIKKGIKIDKVNLGGIGMSAERTKLFKNISASSEERRILKKLIEDGVELKIQIVPTEKSYNLESYL